MSINLAVTGNYSTCRSFVLKGKGDKHSAPDLDPTESCLIREHGIFFLCRPNQC